MKMVKHGRGDMSQQHKKARAKFLRLTQADGKKNDASYMKSVEYLITKYGGPS